MAHDDELILVDLYDRPVGHLDKNAVHEKGLLHRAFSVFLTDGERMLIQRRAYGKYHSGGLWANACCSHPRVGETLQEAVPRRLKEELGICCEVKELGAFVYYARYSDTMHEYEYEHIFIGHFEGEVTPDPEEIAETRWIRFEDLEKEMMEDPDRFSVWFMIAAPQVLAALKQA